MLFAKNPLLSLLLATGLCGHALFAADSAPAMQTIPADDSRFRYEGRFDTTKPEAPAVIWQASRIAIDFEGTALALRFDWVEGQSFFDVTVDGVTAVLGVTTAGQARLAFPQPLGTGRHRLTVFKRSEAAAGHARFLGIEIADGMHAWVPAAPNYKLKLQFIGDSITVGACNEDGTTDQWEDRSTHNNARSYAAFTAAAFAADYRNIAVSGMGIVIGWIEPLAGQIWDRVYPVVGSPSADLATWTPDVVCVNFGENDSSFTTANNRPFPSVAFTEGYVSLVKAIRAAYPAAQIVILRGGMHGGANHEGLRNAWTAAIEKLEASDAKIHHFVFNHWSSNHPRVADDRAMADELIAWLQKQEFMAVHQ